MTLQVSKVSNYEMDAVYQKKGVKPQSIPMNRVKSSGMDELSFGGVRERATQGLVKKAAVALAATVTAAIAVLGVAANNTRPGFIDFGGIFSKIKNMFCDKAPMQSAKSETISSQIEKPKKQEPEFGSKEYWINIETNNINWLKSKGYPVDKWGKKALELAEKGIDPKTIDLDEASKIYKEIKKMACEAKVHEDIVKCGMKSYLAIKGFENTETIKSNIFGICTIGRVTADMNPEQLENFTKAADDIFKLSKGKYLVLKRMSKEQISTLADIYASIPDVNSYDVKYYVKARYGEDVLPSENSENCVVAVAKKLSDMTPEQRLEIFKDADKFAKMNESSIRNLSKEELTELSKILAKNPNSYKELSELTNFYEAKNCRYTDKMLRMVEYLSKKTPKECEKFFDGADKLEKTLIVKKPQTDITSVFYDSLSEENKQIVDKILTEGSSEEHTQLIYVLLKNGISGSKYNEIIYKEIGRSSNKDFLRAFHS